MVILVLTSFRLISYLKIEKPVLLDMSKMVQNLSHPTHDAKDKSHSMQGSPATTKIKTNNENIAKPTNVNQYNFICDLEALEREAVVQSKQVELNDCIEFVSHLVDLFKQTVILPELQSENDWHDDVGHRLKRNKGSTGNSHLDDKVEKIAIKMGLTKEQWNILLYVNITAGDTLDMNKVTRNHLKKVHDMTSRLLEGDEQITVFALIDAIEKHMPKNHYNER
jgi:hypothetical protein